MSSKHQLNLEQSSQFLYATLKEAQDNIRTYDTKAQIVGIGFIFTIGMLIKFNTWGHLATQWQQAATLCNWVLITLPVVCFGSVLYPTRRVAPHVLKNKEVVKGLFYMNGAANVTEYVTQLNNIDLQQELSYELLKVSYLRDLKRQRFLRAMSMASISLLLMLLLLLLPLLYPEL